MSQSYSKSKVGRSFEARSISGTAEARAVEYYTQVGYHVLALLLQTSPERGMVMVTWPF